MNKILYFAVLYLFLSVIEVHAQAKECESISYVDFKTRPGWDKMTLLHKIQAIQIDNWTPGLYIVKAISGEIMLETKVLIK